MKDDPSLICCKCNAALVKSKTAFSYLAHNFFADLPRCPVCGQVFVSEELVREKIASVEKNLEDK